MYLRHSEIFHGTSIERCQYSSVTKSTKGALPWRAQFSPAASLLLQPPAPATETPRQQGVDQASQHQGHHRFVLELNSHRPQRQLHLHLLAPQRYGLPLDPTPTCKPGLPDNTPRAKVAHEHLLLALRLDRHRSATQRELPRGEQLPSSKCALPPLLAGLHEDTHVTPDVRSNHCNSAINHPRGLTTRWMRDKHRQRPR